MTEKKRKGKIWRMQPGSLTLINRISERQARDDRAEEKFLKIMT